METSAYIRTDPEQHGYGRADNACAWKISRDAKAIFEADDRGDAVFITDESSLHDLEMKFPASAGFTYFMDLRTSRSYHNHPRAIVQYNYPIARKSTSWGDIFKEVDRSGMVLVPEKNRFQYYDAETKQNVDPYGKAVPPKTYRTDYTSKTFATADRIERYTNLYGFDSTYIGLYGEVFHGFVRVIKDPKRAKRLQGYLRRQEVRKNRQVPALQVKDLSITNLKELLTAFITEYLLMENFVSVSSNRAKRGKYRGLNQTQERTKTRKMLVQDINAMRQNCIRARRNWREMETHFESRHFHSPYPINFYKQFVSKYIRFIPVLLRSKNPDFQAFGRWLRYEQAFEKRRLKQEAAELEKQAAKTKKSKSKTRRSAKKTQKT